MRKQLSVKTEAKQFTSRLFKRIEVAKKSLESKGILTKENLYKELTNV